ncbi:MAG: hypothetical protein AAF903_12195 [Pseudomonadota bacterium]
MIVFHRTVRKRFVGNYITEFRSQDKVGFEVCPTDGVGRYEPNPQNLWTARLSVYTDGCNIPPGCWVADTTIEFPAWSGASKSVSVRSAPFSVSDEGSVKNHCDPPAPAAQL